MAGLLRPTDREIQCLLTLARVGNAAETADELGITGQTLKNNLWTLRRKLGVRSNLQAYYSLVQGVKMTVTTEIKLENS